MASKSASSAPDVSTIDPLQQTSVCDSSFLSWRFSLIFSTFFTKNVANLSGNDVHVDGMSAGRIAGDLFKSVFRTRNTFFTSALFNFSL